METLVADAGTGPRHHLGAARPGPGNAITDVAGVRVGHTTLIQGDGPVSPTGAHRSVFPARGRPGHEPVFAGCHVLNGNGEMTGLVWVRESGLLTTPVAITNTHSVGVVRDALIAARRGARPPRGAAWSLPVVAETWDGLLNDIDGMHVRARARLRGARGRRRRAGGRGLRRRRHGHDLPRLQGRHRHRLAGAGARPTAAGRSARWCRPTTGRASACASTACRSARSCPPTSCPVPGAPGPGRGGSIIIVVATDAPLLPAPVRPPGPAGRAGRGAIGGVGENSSGDIFLAFATGNRGLAGGQLAVRSRCWPARARPAVLRGHVEATEEAIVNALVAAETMTGRDGAVAHRLDHDRLLEIMARYRPRPAR